MIYVSCWNCPFSTFYRIHVAGAALARLRARLHSWNHWHTVTVFDGVDVLRYQTERGRPTSVEREHRPSRKAGGR